MAGAALNVRVNAVDANWNIVSSTDIVAIPSSDANAILPANAALVAGTKSFSVTLRTAGTATITATDTTDGTKTANASPSITVNAGTATKFVITGSTTQTAGTSQNLTITAQDAFGNTATTYTGVKSLTFTGAGSSTNPVTAPTVKDNAV